MRRFAVLVVCTANICRSPLAELLLADRLDAERFEVASGGVRGWDGSPMDGDVQVEAKRLGVDPAPFRSRPLARHHLSAADLVLTATREHRAAVLDLEPAALRRSFTLRELAGLAPLAEGEDLAGWVGSAARLRSRGPVDADVPDPYRRAAETHREVADLLDATTRTIAQHLNTV